MARMQRIGGARPQEFTAPLLASGRPVRFRLNDRVVVGVEGDSVLSATLASGIDAVGLHRGHAVGLSEKFAPPILDRNNRARADLAVPMALCPAMEGMDLVTLAPPRSRTGWRAIVRPGRRRDSGLGIDLDAAALDFSPWLDNAPDVSEQVDCVVVGGGLSGMAAARAAAEAGLDTVLLEDKQALGGYASYFGRAEDEPDPALAIAELSGALAASDRASVRLGTLATRIAPGLVEAVGVAVEGSVPHPRRTRFSARLVILATGTTELLPVVPGNRLPGVMLSTTVWSLAHRFGLWPGASALLHVSANAGYRLALLGSDCGVRITQASDPRIAPQSRFIEFCKAYGFRLRWGTGIDTILRDSGRLGVFHRDLQSGRAEETPELIDTAILSGGFAPELSLWIAAGGGIEAGPDGRLTLADPALPGVAVAGFAAGYQSHTGALASGRVAVARLLGAPMEPVSDIVIDPGFETPQALYPGSGPGRPGEARAYFGSGRSLSAMARPEAPRRLLGTSLIGRRVPPQAQLDNEPFALSLDDCLGKFASGGVSASQLERLLAERCVSPVRLETAHAATEASETAMPQDPRRVPDFLVRRFGPTQHVWHLAVPDGRRLSPGALVHLNSDRTRPPDAVGAILGDVAGLGTVGVFGAGRRAGERLVVRDGTSAVGVRLVARAEAD